LLQAVDVGFAYGTARVLDGVSLAVERGAVVGVLGPNGSGKTTLLRLLAGVLAPKDGRVLLEGRDLGAISRRSLARRIAVVPQDTRLTFDYRVQEIALMGRHPHLGPFEIEGPADIEAAGRALAATGTQTLAARFFETLSGGERQRVVIASALAQFMDAPEAGGAMASRVLLLDEPTASLDLRYQIDVGLLLRRLNRERGLTIVVSTHDLNFAAAVCTALVFLRQGRVVAAGPTGAVLTRDAVSAVYDVEADVRFHAAAGHLTVVPLPGRMRPPGDALEAPGRTPEA
jgi:iron complex transport system ATP-binding protein